MQRTRSALLYIPVLTDIKYKCTLNSYHFCNSVTEVITCQCCVVIAMYLQTNGSVEHDETYYVSNRAAVKIYNPFRV